MCISWLLHSESRVCVCVCLCTLFCLCFCGNVLWEWVLDLIWDLHLSVNLPLRWYWHQFTHPRCWSSICFLPMVLLASVVRVLPYISECSYLQSCHSGQPTPLPSPLPPLYLSSLSAANYFLYPLSISLTVNSYFHQQHCLDHPPTQSLFITTRWFKDRLIVWLWNLGKCLDAVVLRVCVCLRHTHTHTYTYTLFSPLGQC